MGLHRTGVILLEFDINHVSMVFLASNYQFNTKDTDTHKIIYIHN